MRLGFWHEFLYHLVDAEARRPGAGRELFKGLEPLGNQRLRRDKGKESIGHPFVVEHTLVAALERIGAQVEKLGEPHFRERLPPYAEPRVAMLFKHDLPFVHADGQQFAIVAPVEEAWTR